MLKAIINGVEKEIKSELNEISLEDFEKICVCLTKEFEDSFEKHLEIFSILGLSEEDIDSIIPVDFLNLVRLFRSVPWESSNFVNEITVEGKTYTAFTGEKYTLSIRDLAKVEKYIKRDKTKYIGELIAIIYKDKSLTKEEQYSEETITKNAELFRKNITADIALPYINLILKDVVLKLKGDVK